MTSSCETAAGTRVAPMPTPDLREGTWTRLGDDSVLGDQVTEGLLGDLAERTRAAARSQGYAVGWADGQRRAREAAEHTERELRERADRAESERRAEHDAAVVALRRAAHVLAQSVTDACSTVEQQASALALALTEEIVGRTPDTEADAVRRVLRVLPEDGLATVRMHPRVARSLAAAEITDRGIAVVPDDGLAAHDAVVELADSLVQIDVRAALRRVREVLG